jgi:hypothetical protein
MASASASEPSQSANVKCVRVVCNADFTDAGQYIEEEVPATHPVFRDGKLSPISKVLGLPVRVHRLDPRPSTAIPRDPGFDNQRITFLMIDPRFGIAPPAWQQGIGTVIVARDDGQPLTPRALEVLGMYIDQLMDKYEDGPDAVTPEDLSPEVFAEWSAMVAAVDDDDDM